MGLVLLELEDVERIVYVSVGFAGDTAQSDSLTSTNIQYQFDNVEAYLII